MSLATTTIGELNPGAPLQGSDLFVIERVGGANFKMTADEVSTFIGGGGGEVNLGANVGSGTGLVFRDKTGVTLNFKSLIQGANITLTNNANDIEIEASGGGASPTTTQGDLIARNLSVDDRVPIGSPGQVLTVTTVPDTLIAWADIPTTLQFVNQRAARDREFGSGGLLKDSYTLHKLRIDKTICFSK